MLHFIGGGALGSVFSPHQGSVFLFSQTILGESLFSLG